MISYKDIVEKCHFEKKKDHKIYYYHRFLSLPLTVLFFRLRVRPDIISISMIILSLASFCLMVNENKTIFLLGCGVSFLAFLFDKVDGDLARLYNIANIKGAIYDFVYHRMSLFLFYLGIGIHFSYQNEYLIILAASCGFIANYIEEMQLLSFRIFAHKYLGKNEKLNIPKKIKRINEPVLVKLLKVFRAQLYLYYLIIITMIINSHIDSSVFYFTCIALLSMCLYSILQVVYSIKYTFDRDMENMLKKI